MPGKRSKKAPKKVRSLKAKSLGGSQSKGVRGGLNPQPLPPRWAPPTLQKDPIKKIY